MMVEAINGIHFAMMDGFYLESVGELEVHPAKWPTEEHCTLTVMMTMARVYGQYREERDAQKRMIGG